MKRHVSRCHVQAKARIPGIMTGSALVLTIAPSVRPDRQWMTVQSDLAENGLAWKVLEWSIPPVKRRRDGSARAEYPATPLRIVVVGPGETTAQLEHLYHYNRDAIAQHWPWIQDVSDYNRAAVVYQNQAYGDDDTSYYSYTRPASADYVN